MAYGIVSSTSTTAGGKTTIAAPHLTVDTFVYDVNTTINITDYLENLTHIQLLHLIYHIISVETVFYYAERWK